MEIRPYEPAHLDDAGGVLARAHESRFAELPALQMRPAWLSGRSRIGRAVTATAQRLKVFGKPA